MILPKIKIWHFLIGTAGILLSFRFDKIIDGLILGGQHFLLFFTNFSNAIKFVNLNLIDLYFSLLLLISIPIIVIYFKKHRFLNYNLSGISTGIIILVFVFIFSPLITAVNPNMQFNFENAKLKQPFSTIKVLKGESLNLSINDRFLFYRDSFQRTYEDEFFISSKNISETEKSFLIDVEKGLKVYKNDLIKYKISSVYFLFGTDELGRDIFSRIIVGTRFSIIIGFFSVVVAMLLGISIGFLGGYFESKLDFLFNRLIDLFLAFPLLFLIIFLVSLFESSITLLILILGFAGWMSLAKLVRGEVIKLKNQSFIITAKLLGYNSRDILLKEFLPNLLIPITVNLIFLFVNIVLAESALSFLGLGIQDSYPTWGGMIQQGQEYLSKGWWISFFPGIVLIITLLFINNLGNYIKLRFDPKVEL